jgi:hypothetical protein
VNELSITTRLSTKINRRIFATIIGIAFCTTYLTGTIAMVGGLHDTTSTLASSFDQGPVLVYTDEDFAASTIDGNCLPGNDTRFVAFCFANVTLWDFHGRSSDNVYAVSVYDPEDSLGLNMTNESVDCGVWMGTQLVDMLAQDSINYGSDDSYILERGNNSANVHVSALYAEWSIFPDDWLLIPRDKMDTLRPDLAGNYSFLMILESDIQLDGQACFSGDASSRPTSGVVGFFENGIYQVEQGLWGIILMSGIITALLVYCIISIETEFSAPTIKVLRGIGASRNYVIGIFLLKSLFITFAGGVLGMALGFCAANAISSVSSLLDIMSFITPKASLGSVVLPVLISMAAGMIGGLWPAIRASKMFAPRRAGP